MILLAVASCLLFFITYFTGILTTIFLKKFLQADIAANFFETFLLGLIVSFIWFNIVSFFIPVTYLSLLPLLLISTIAFLNKLVRQLFFSQIRQTAGLFFSVPNIFFILPFLALFLFYWIVPPLNWDSGEYHYIAIRWYEQFKLVPGLANIHGRLAFNPANFIISSAYAFTGLTGQSLYPLNGVLALAFFTWMLKKILAPPVGWYNLIVFILTVSLFRITLANISSPSSDLLSGILLFYCGFRTYDLIKTNKTAVGDYLPVIIICCFSTTAKLTAIPSLLILPFIYFILLKNGKQFSVVIKCSLLMLLIIAPWLARNFLLSGYFLYPVPGSNIFHADWSVPKDVVKLDYLFSKYGPRTITVGFITMQKMNILQLIQVWFQYIIKSSLSSFLITLAALISPISWLFFAVTKRKIPGKLFMLWLIYYSGVWVWFLTSPEHRFGLPYLALATALPFLELPGTIQFTRKQYIPVLTILSCFLSLHYALAVFQRHSFYTFSAADCWLKPLRDHRYFKQNDLHTFPYSKLGNGVKLYFPDENHECLNADGPCMNWRYGAVEMRGTRIEDGFRNVKDEVRQYFPFIDIKK